MLDEQRTEQQHQPSTDEADALVAALGRWLADVATESDDEAA